MRGARGKGVLFAEFLKGQPISIDTVCGEGIFVKESGTQYIGTFHKDTLRGIGKEDLCSN